MYQPNANTVLKNIFLVMFFMRVTHAPYSPSGSAIVHDSEFSSSCSQQLATQLASYYRANHVVAACSTEILARNDIIKPVAIGGHSTIDSGVVTQDVKMNTIDGKTFQFETECNTDSSIVQLISIIVVCIHTLGLQLFSSLQLAS